MEEEEFRLRRHRYYFDLILEGMDKFNLADCIVDEYLPLTAQMPIWDIAGKIREGHFHFEHESAEELEEFPKNLEAFSAYLHQVVKGFHAIEEVGENDVRLVEARKILALRGELVTLPLRLPPTLLLNDLDPDAEDLDHIEAHWRGYPRWFQDGMRRKHPYLRRL